MTHIFLSHPSPRTNNYTTTIHHPVLACSKRIPYRLFRHPTSAPLLSPSTFHLHTPSWSHQSLSSVILSPKTTILLSRSIYQKPSFGEKMLYVNQPVSSQSRASNRLTDSLSCLLKDVTSMGGTFSAGAAMLTKNRKV